MATYKLTCWSDEYIVRADLTQASAAIIVDGAGTPYQTADFRHRLEDLRVGIAEWLYSATGDHDADFQSAAEITLIEEGE